MILDHYKNNAIIGHTGFIGKNLCDRISFKDFFNSQNIDQIIGKSYDYIICAAPSAEKWKINIDGTKDLENINIILDVLSTVKVDNFILLSSIDIYGKGISLNPDETSIPSLFENHNYGENRIFFENSLSKIFGEKLDIFRLSGLFGDYLKKNIIFDIKENRQDMFCKFPQNSSLQWYNINELKYDIDQHIGKKIINLVNEPVLTSDIMRIKNIKTFDSNHPIKYGVKSKHFFGGYKKTEKEVIQDIKIFLS